MRTVTINAVLNGWTVHVGCQLLVYRTSSDLALDLVKYLDAPDKAAYEKKFIEGSVNAYINENTPSVLARVSRPPDAVPGEMRIQTESVPDSPPNELIQRRR